MKVKCISQTLSEEQRIALGVSSPGRPKYNITIGATYTVLAITIAFESSISGSCPLLDIVTDGSGIVPAPIPMCLFEILDGRVSKYWEAKKIDEFSMTIWPSEFYAEYFHDRLSDGDPDAYRIMQSVRKKLEEESSS
jgi:hypothetical protein